MNPKPIRSEGHDWMPPVNPMPAWAEKYLGAPKYDPSQELELLRTFYKVWKRKTTVEGRKAKTEELEGISKAIDGYLETHPK